MSTRISEIEALRVQARSASITDDKGFVEILGMFQSLLEMSDQQIADSIKVSRPTVNRWIRGKNLPHRGMRKPLFDWIVTQTTKRMRFLESEGRKGYTSAPTVQHALAAKSG